MRGLQWKGKATDLLYMHGDCQFTPIWSCAQAWRAATRQWESGNLDEASALFYRIRQTMLQVHLDQYPEDSLWNNK